MYTHIFLVLSSSQSGIRFKNVYAWHDGPGMYVCMSGILKKASNYAAKEVCFILVHVNVVKFDELDWNEL